MLRRLRRQRPPTRLAIDSPMAQRHCLAMYRRCSYPPIREPGRARTLPPHRHLHCNRERPRSNRRRCYMRSHGIPPAPHPGLPLPLRLPLLPLPGVLGELVAMCLQPLPWSGSRIAGCPSPWNPLLFDWRPRGADRCGPMCAAVHSTTTGQGHADSELRAVFQKVREGPGQHRNADVQWGHHLGYVSTRPMDHFFRPACSVSPISASADADPHVCWRLIADTYLPHRTFP